MLKPLLLALGLAAVGCKDASKDVEALADRACACAKDAACGKVVLEDFVKWAEANKDARGDLDKAKAAAERLVGCVQTAGVDAEELMSAGTRLKKLAE